MDFNLLPPYLHLNETAKLINENYTLDFLLRKAELEDFPIYWRAPERLVKTFIYFGQKGDLEFESIETGEFIRFEKNQIRNFLEGDKAILPTTLCTDEKNGKSGFKVILSNWDATKTPTGEFISAEKLDAYLVEQRANHHFWLEDSEPFEKLKAFGIPLKDAVILKSDFLKLMGIAPSENDNKSNTFGNKGKYSYLRTIQALSSALIDGLTGKHNKDADAVLAALAKKGVPAPLKKDTLAGYLEAAEDLH